MSEERQQRYDQITDDEKKSDRQHQNTIAKKIKKVLSDFIIVREVSYITILETQDPGAWTEILVNPIKALEAPSLRGTRENVSSAGSEKQLRRNF